MSDHERPDVEMLRSMAGVTAKTAYGAGTIHDLCDHALRLERELAQVKAELAGALDGRAAVLAVRDDALAERDAAREALASLRARCAEVLGPIADKLPVHPDPRRILPHNYAVAITVGDLRALAGLLEEAQG